MTYNYFNSHKVHFTMPIPMKKPDICRSYILQIKYYKSM